MKKFLTHVIRAIRRRFTKEVPSPAPQAKPENTPPVPAKPFTTQARRRRETLLSRPSFLYVYDTTNDIFHDRECKHVQAIPDEAFTMQEWFPKDKNFCTSCCRKAMIRMGMASQSHRINSYVHAFNSFGAKKEDLYKLFIHHKAQVISISKGKQAVCIQVGDDRWRIQKQDSKLILHHNNYKVLPSGERIFYGDFHRQNIGGSGSFSDVARLVCSHTTKTYKAPGSKGYAG